MMRALFLSTALGLAAGGVAAAPAPPLKFVATYPRQATAIPALRAYLEGQEARLRSTAVATQRKDAVEARQSGFRMLPYEYEHRWTLVTETGRFVSLLVDRYDFTGGAHGMDSYDSILWDKAASRPRASLSMFADPARLSATIRPAYCRALDAERRRKRVGDFNPRDKEFNACIDPVKQTVILGSSTRTRFDRIGIIADPYEAGPYAEGAYEVTLPVTPAILAQVRPEYPPYFAVAGTP